MHRSHLFFGVVNVDKDARESLFGVTSLEARQLWVAWNLKPGTFDPHFKLSPVSPRL
jgi:hypothetical protein